MIKNFESVKQQLKELAEIVNSYKSEAVQLRLVELVLPGPHREASESIRTEEEKTLRVGRQRGRKRRRATSTAGGAEFQAATTPRQRGGKKRGSLGPKAAFGRLYREGFFKTPRTIGAVVEHAETSLATKIKQSDISGILARYARDKKLKREKNTDGQYEYTQPSA